MSDKIFKREKAWGLTTSLDLHECNPETVEDKDKIKKYILDLCDLIKMRRYGEPQIVYFGKDENIKGYTAVQLIETSSITAHFGLNPDKTGYGYIDVFSCKSYDPKVVSKFTKDYFEAKSFNENIFFRKYWFEEKFEADKGRGLKIEIEKKLEDINTKYQHLQIFETKAFGRMLVLDSAVMLTEYDEFAYHEMIAHVALNTHPNPKRVLVIGGGDGGVVREIVKHKEVEEIHLCDIDEEVIKMSKKYFPNVSSGYKDGRVKVFIENGAEFIKNNKNYDIIIVDSPDPVGPAESLFSEEFYNIIYDALKEDGILITQSESMFYHQKLISNLSNFIPKIFPRYWHYYTLVPTYPSGEIGFSFCSKKYNPLEFNKNRARSIKGLKYYNEDIHIASFKLPNFIKNKVYYNDEDEEKAF